MFKINWNLVAVIGGIISGVAVIAKGDYITGIGIISSALVGSNSTPKKQEGNN